MNLPAVNASLNLASALLLAAGYALIRKGYPRAHRACMLGAFGISLLFLISYVTYHWHAGHVHYRQTGAWRTVYLMILSTHTLLAIVIVPLILRTLFLALRGRFESHRRWARWTLPLWFYVSVTGVVIFEMLY